MRCRLCCPPVEVSGCGLPPTRAPDGLRLVCSDFHSIIADKSPLRPLVLSTPSIPFSGVGESRLASPILAICLSSQPWIAGLPCS